MGSLEYGTAADVFRDGGTISGAPPEGKMTEAGGAAGAASL